MDFIIDEEFKQRNRKQTKQERLYLEALIEEYGCDDGALTVAQIGGAGPYLLVDGHNTVEICTAQGKPMTEPRLLLFKDRQEALEWIDRKQEGRRNLTPEELEDRAARRRLRVDAARADGKSVRSIAKAEGVSVSTVHKDLNVCDRCKRVGKVADCEACQELASSVRPRTPAGKPEPKVQGADSKTYSPSKPKATRKRKKNVVDQAPSKPERPPGARSCPLCGMGFIPQENHDELWDAIVKVTHADSKLNATQIGKACKNILGAGYTAADVLKLPPILHRVWPKVPCTIGVLEKYVSWVKDGPPENLSELEKLRRQVSA